MVELARLLGAEKKIFVDEGLGHERGEEGSSE
jgi:hypothetical protein